jgi:hypothetical protein
MANVVIDKSIDYMTVNPDEKDKIVPAKHIKPHLLPQPKSWQPKTQRY